MTSFVLCPGGFQPDVSCSGGLCQGGLSLECPARGRARLDLALSFPAVCDAWLLPYPLTREMDVSHQGSIMLKEPGITDCSSWPAGADPVPVALVSSDFSG